MLSRWKTLATLLLALMVVPLFPPAAALATDINGTVVDAAGAPVAGAYVALIDANGNPMSLGETTTDSAGRFTFSGVVVPAQTDLLARDDAAEGWVHNVMNGGTYTVVLQPIVAEDASEAPSVSFLAPPEAPSVSAAFRLPVPPTPLGWADVGDLTAETLADGRNRFIPDSLTLVSDLSGETYPGDGNSLPRPSWRIFHHED